MHVYPNDDLKSFRQAATTLHATIKVYTVYDIP